MENKDTFPNIPEYDKYMKQKDKKREKTPDGAYDLSINSTDKL